MKTFQFLMLLPILFCSKTTKAQLYSNTYNAKAFQKFLIVSQLDFLPNVKPTGSNLITQKHTLVNSALPDSVHTRYFNIENYTLQNELSYYLPYSSQKTYYQYYPSLQLKSSYSITFNDDNTWNNSKIKKFNTEGKLTHYAKKEPGQKYFCFLQDTIFSHQENILYENNNIKNKTLTIVEKVHHDFYSDKEYNYYYNNQGLTDSVLKKELFPATPPTSGCGANDFGEMTYFDLYEKNLYFNNNNTQYKLFYKPLAVITVFNQYYKFIHCLEKTATTISNQSKNIIYKYFDKEKPIDYHDLETMTEQQTDTSFNWNKVYETEIYYNEMGKRDSLEFIYKTRRLPTNLGEEYFTVQKYKAYYAYNSAGLISEVIFTKPANSASVKWNTFCKQNYYYTEGGAILLYQKKVWDSRNELWLTDETRKYYYPGLPTDIKNLPNKHANSKLKLYPNPVAETVFLSNIVPGTFYYEIANTQGKTLLKGTGKNNQLNVSSLKHGVYILSIQSNHQNYVSKLIKN